jgi:hypothetical protein
MKRTTEIAAFFFFLTGGTLFTVMSVGWIRWFLSGEV